ncbi:hypothetical protein Sango_1584900 [Sesamum angolense]|uniref:RNase H type-1 domain-containing protein n=1 Tax=Sesamum angolense TaxID=2727404 RepID=A0AAE1WQQ6_9LAMI|nr:hypothetical protein Sango_1584900 [Sesamum angolense]
MAALSRFISKSVEKDLPFFKILRKVKDFEWTEECQRAFEELKAYLAKLPSLEEVPEERLWLLYVDRSFTAQESGAGIVITAPQGEDMEFAIKFNFISSNNEAEYEALVLGMRMAQDADALHLLIEELKTKFKSFQLQQIPKEENVKANSLLKLASTLEDYKTRHITMQHLPQPRAPLNIQSISLSDNDWWMPIIRWKDEGHLPRNRWEATRIKTRAIRFLTQGGTLYKKSFTHPLLCCLSQEEGLHVLKKYTMDVVDPISGPGHWPTKHYELGISSPL